ncbi:MAG: hypothetical protein WC239_08415 [Sphaerochaetaceae bacterium]
MPTISATYTGETVFEITAVQVLPDHPHIVRAPKAIAFQVAFFPDALKCLEVIFNELEVGTLARFALFIGMTIHALRVWQANLNCRLTTA